jgi:Flp pilus assembly protein TadG
VGVARWRGAGDRGSGLISMTFGVLVFLVLLLFSVHTILYLHTRSVVANAALVGANRLAGAGDAALSPQAEADAQAQVTRLLGPRARSWRGDAAGNPDDPGYVTFTVSLDAAQVSRAPWFADRIERSARVRIERVQ